MANQLRHQQRVAQAGRADTSMAEGREGIPGARAPPSFPAGVSPIKTMLWISTRELGEARGRLEGRDSTIEGLQATLGEKDRTIAALDATVRDKNMMIADLQATVHQKDLTIAELKAQLERDQIVKTKNLEVRIEKNNNRGRVTKVDGVVIAWPKKRKL